jgi:alpha-tubulin suppressor-like RCC1 family protein
VYEFTRVPIFADVSGVYPKIMQAHCGLDFTLLLSTKGEVLSAGNSEYGINCTQDESTDLLKRSGLCKEQFTIIPANKLGGHPIKFLSAGEEHAAAINNKGELFTWGLNDQGQCGVEIADTEMISAPVQPFKGLSMSQISFVACGGKHTLALSAHREVYAWGNNQFGQLGLAIEEYESFHTPR